MLLTVYVVRSIQTVFLKFEFILRDVYKQTEIFLIMFLLDPSVYRYMHLLYGIKTFGDLHTLEADCKKKSAIGESGRGTLIAEDMGRPFAAFRMRICALRLTY